MSTIVARMSIAPIMLGKPHSIFAHCSVPYTTFSVPYSTDGSGRSKSFVQDFKAKHLEPRDCKPTC